MEKREVIKLLGDYNWIVRSIEEANKEIEICKDTIDAARQLSAIDYSEEAVGGTSVMSDATYNAFQRVEEVSKSLEYWNKRLSELYSKRQLILSWLDMLDHEERMIIEFKNIKNMKWYMVASAMNYSERQCKRIGRKALEKITCPEMSRFLC